MCKFALATKRGQPTNTVSVPKVNPLQMLRDIPSKVTMTQNNIVEHIKHRDRDANQEEKVQGKGTVTEKVVKLAVRGCIDKMKNRRKIKEKIWN